MKDLKQDNVNLSSWNCIASKVCLKIIKWCANWIKTAYRCGLWIAYFMLGKHDANFSLFIDRQERLFIIRNCDIMIFKLKLHIYYSVCTFLFCIQEFNKKSNEAGLFKFLRYMIFITIFTLSYYCTSLNELLKKCCLTLL